MQRSLSLYATFWAVFLILATAARAARQVNIQVTNPPPLPKDAKQCTQTLIVHTFANSYYEPAIAKYSPPTDCGPIGSWAGISLNLTVTSNGVQYDRLAVFTFHDIEIWRTSTSEPGQSPREDGIIWTYLKDMTRFIPLFSKPGDFAFELDNIVTESLDGTYATTVAVTFYASSKDHPAAKKADLIFPISSLSGHNPASVPPDTTFNLTFPRSTVEVYAEIFASGNAQGEEFWYLNAANGYASDVENGPFREVRLLVDGKVAGTAFPYAVLFTGAIVPSAWGPIASYGAHDLPSYFIDLTPLVPNLVDGKAHTFSLSVSSAEKDHAINPNWYVTGFVQVVTDPSKKATTGKIIKYEVEPFAHSSISSSVNPSGDTIVTVKASRSVHIESQIVSGSGKINNVVFAQDLSFSNAQTIPKDGAVEHVLQTTFGQVLSTHNGVKSVVDIYSYPLEICMTWAPQTSAIFDHSYDRTVLPAPFILGSTVQEHQLASGARSARTGYSNNTFTYTDTAGNTYDREVNAALGKFTYDHQGGSLAPQLSLVPFYSTSDFEESEYHNEDKGVQFRIVDYPDRLPASAIPETARFPKSWQKFIYGEEGI